MIQWLLSTVENAQNWLASDVTKNSLQSIQNLTVIFITVFTARWTYKTFAHKERIDELKKLKIEIENYHSLVQMHCAQVRETKKFTDEMLNERIQMAQSHNKILMLNRTSFYNRKKFREKIQNIVGSWITKDKLDAMMNWNPSKKQNQARWKEFDKEYQKAMKLIDKEASKYI